MSFAYAMMTHNTSLEEFFPIVIKSIATNLNIAETYEVTGNKYSVHFDIFQFELNQSLCALTKSRGAYALDSLVLRMLIAAGYDLSGKRTPYLEKCLPNYFGKDW